MFIIRKSLSIFLFNSYNKLSKKETFKNFLLSYLKPKIDSFKNGLRLKITRRIGYVM